MKVFKLLSVSLAVGSILLLTSCGSVEGPASAGASSQDEISTGGLAKGPASSAVAQAIAVQRRHTNALLAVPGVVGTAVGEGDDGRPVVLILTSGEGPAPTVPANLENVPVRVEVVGVVRALKGSTPKIDVQPADQVVDEGQTATFSVAANTRGGGDLSYQWRKDGIDIGGANASTYTIASVAQSDEGSYDVVVANTNGSVTSDAATLTVSTTGPSAPSIITNPQDQTVVVGESASFSVVAGGTQPLLYQWRKEGVDIGGATADTYAIAAAALEDAGSYDVVVTNDLGSVTSDPAVLTVTSAPPNPYRFDRPVPIGVSFGHPDITAGTIGCRIVDGDGNVFALTNNHVAANSNQATIGDNVLQPGPYDGGVDPADAIGTLFDFEPIKFDGSDNEIDAAIVATTTDMLGNSTPADGYGTPQSTTYVVEYFNQRVKKYGRTTGYTEGRVVAINGTFNVSYGGGNVARFVHQVVIRPGSFSAGGDSGSLIVASGGSIDGEPVGLLFAGSNDITIANPIDPVLARFGVTVDGQ